MNNYLHEDDLLWASMAYSPLLHDVLPSFHDGNALTVNTRIFKKHIDRLEICNMLGANFTLVMTDILVIFALNGKFERLVEIVKSGVELPKEVSAAIVFYVGKNKITSKYYLELLKKINGCNATHGYCKIDNMDAMIKMKYDGFGKFIDIAAARYGNMDVLHLLKKMRYNFSTEDAISAAILGGHHDAYKFLKGLYGAKTTTQHHNMALYSGDPFFIKECCRNLRNYNNVLEKYDPFFPTPLTAWAAYAGNMACLSNKGHVNQYCAFAILGQQMKLLVQLWKYPMKFPDMDSYADKSRTIFYLAERYFNSEANFLLMTLKRNNFRILKWVIKRLPNARKTISGLRIADLPFTLDEKIIDFLHAKYGLSGRDVFTYAMHMGNFKKARRFEMITDMRDLIIAVRSGNIKMIKWVYDLVEWPQDTKQLDAAIYQTNSIEVIDWARNVMDLDFHEFSRQCVMNGNLYVLKYLNTLCELRYHYLRELAANNRQWQIVAWIISFDCCAIKRSS